jgi:3-deoxy-D-manno-octulosonic-acid transferase
MLSTFYRVATDLAAPAISLYLRRRLATGREDPARFSERLGEASRPRPPGQLVWCHAASVGEAMSVLSLLRALRASYPSLTFLLTTGTVTSAKLLEKRLPEGVLHQYMPVDRAPYVQKFLDHWQPDLALWMESELWPNMVMALKQRKIPALLLNGRMSEKSFHHWRYARVWIEELLSAFPLCLAQTADERERFMKLGAKDVRYIGNLKYAAEPLSFDFSLLEHLSLQIGKRPVWLMASTHAGEDEIALAVHTYCAKRWPDLLTIIVPRHPTRGDAIAKLIAARGLNGERRSKNLPILRNTHVYLADTMGELGLLYQLAPIVCIGGSFVWGGHNPIEAAQLKRAIVFGPRMTNFAAIAEEMVAAGAARQVADAESLAPIIASWLEQPDKVAAMAEKAGILAAQKHGVLEAILETLKQWMDDLTKEQAR